ncbi:hypothetical protein L6164_001298 [Bauhinia variegata]|uniref:Uncharacterized protein n=1 Tax=Bauhinia variegata TaxID=167791 RepID=A0ACB9Q9E3_BAUVA|nr:hypothetical protein L6164_001298 [Bauhinia variegata]
MRITASALQLLLLLRISLFLLICQSGSPDGKKTYIVYMGSGKIDEASALSLYTSMLQEVADSNAEPKLILHHYKRTFNGFAVKLTEAEAERIAGLNSVVSVFPNKHNELHTTRSWDFIGFPMQVQRLPTESDVIIGVLDTGIWPESESFSDKGLGPPPSKWKGTCQTSANFTCNNKIIGAKYYKANGAFRPEDLRSPRDSNGHGTHVASTAAGNQVNKASMAGLGLGIARGAVPSARIAAYKVCWRGCADADILAAFDDAIADGVDILSVSLGGFNYDNYFQSAIAIGAFHAMRNGILTITSAGNSGPNTATLANFAPWLVSVAASNKARKFIANVKLGNNKTYEGISINTFDLKGKMYPIIYGGDAPNTKAGISGSESRFCLNNELDRNLVKGKIVLCEGKSTGTGAFLAGAVGIVTHGYDHTDFAAALPLPGSYLFFTDGVDVLSYINSSRIPTATILKSEEVKELTMVASFSSRGPNHLTPDILKPDLIAPGVEILAAWPQISPVTHVKGDIRTLEFNIISGTSMSCPHVSGAAAYVKSFHPEWSPAAIQSALMTTAKPWTPEENSMQEFAYGAGQIDPIKALNPGLVYDAGESDFIEFLCGQNYSTKTLQRVTGTNSSCSKFSNVTARDLNYPSFAFYTAAFNPTNATFKRTVTNVGSPISTYKATVTAPQGLKIQVNPSVLSFTSLGQKQTFVLSIEGTLEEILVSASLVWSDGKFHVRSPVIVHSYS